jgi:HlyD family secretion protein
VAGTKGFKGKETTIMASGNDDIQATLGVRTAGARWRRLAWLLGVLIVLVVGGSMMWKSAQASAARPMVQYRTENIKMGSLRVNVTATGQLQPTKTITVGSEVSGILDEVLVDYNDYVRVGQVVAKVNTEKLTAAVLQSDASLQAARAKVDDAKVTVIEKDLALKRIVDARKRTNNQLPSKQDLEAAQAAYDRAKVAVASAEASVRQAEATLSQDKTNLSKAVIKSPVDGVVLTRVVDPGQTITAGFNTPTLFTIARDLHQMELQVNIDEADVGEVKAGQTVGFTVDAYPGRVFPGRITQVRFQSTTTSGVVTYTAVITVSNPEMLLRPGMTATASITVKEVKSALLTPNTALRFTPAAQSEQEDKRGFLGKLMPGPPPMGNKKGEDEAPEPAAGAGKLWTLKDGHPKLLPVKIGATNGKVTEVLAGPLAAGTPVIIDTLRAGK